LSKQSTIAPVNNQLLSWTIENLIKNGIDAMKGEGEILISTFISDTRLIILVKDSGEGVKSENFNKIFSPGFTTKKRGWGIGLSLAKRIIIDYHRGKIFLKNSIPGKETTISIELLRSD
jgi:signal transduction histidine kinase